MDQTVGTSLNLEIQFDGLTRTYRLYRPPALSEAPGLVVVLHGAIGSGDEIAALTQFDKEADRLGWIVVYPDAHSPGPFGGWSTFATPFPVDDVGFIALLIEEVGAQNGVDPSRVYATGFSRGGMLAHRLGCELSELIVAIAPVAGNMSDWNGDVDNLPSQPSHPVSVLVVHGSLDREVPIEGGASPDYPHLIPYAPLSDVIRRWREFNHCSDSFSESQSGAVTTRRWEGAAGTCVELQLIDGGGHVWPGHDQPGSPEAALVASRVIADFFVAHKRH